jgi:hypothetical protein
MYLRRPTNDSSKKGRRREIVSPRLTKLWASVPDIPNLGSDLPCLQGY